jgi:hypothetical protein
MEMGSPEPRPWEEQSINPFLDLVPFETNFMLHRVSTIKQDVQAIMLSFEAISRSNLLEGDIVMAMVEGDEKLKTLA